MDQPLVIIGSARMNGNTKKMVDFVFAGRNYTEIDLLAYQLFPYNYDDDYPTSDRFEELVEIINQHKIIIFATPVYWYAMSGLMKTLFDRLTTLVTTKKEMGRNLKGKTVSLIAVGTDPELPDGFEIPFSLTASYLKMNYQQRIYFTEDQHIIDLAKQQEIKAFLSRISG